MRRAISLIELLFTLTLLAISFSTLPLLIQQSSRLDMFSIQQESITAASTKLRNILSYRWDENALQDGVVRVLDVSGGNAQYERNESIEGNRSRTGHFAFTKRRAFFVTQTFPSGIVDGDDDLDDFDGQSVVLSSGGKDDYKQEIQMDIAVGFVDDMSTSLPTTKSLAQSNLKMIEISTSTLVLRAYSANIGQQEILTRSFE